jgi:S-methylmethionine-dependent homocysteine/selenocysteine methylase
MAQSVISGCIGPRGDGYTPAKAMSAREAAEYHAGQARAFADSAADMITAITMNYVQEAIGIAQAAERARMPVAISFTVETDGACRPGRRWGTRTTPWTPQRSATRRIT